MTRGGDTDGEWQLQPNSKNCYACGLENTRGLALRFYQNQAHEVRCRIKLPTHFEGYPGIAHGGVVATIMDEVLARAGMAEDDHQFMVTATLSYKFRKPVPTGEILEFRGRLKETRKRLKFAEGELRLPNGEIAVTAEAMLAEHPMGEVGPGELDDLGWRVYPE